MFKLNFVSYTKVIIMLEVDENVLNNFFKTDTYDIRVF